MVDMVVLLDVSFIILNILYITIKSSMKTEKADNPIKPLKNNLNNLFVQSVPYIELSSFFRDISYPFNIKNEEIIVISINNPITKK